MNAEQLQAIKARREAITPGVWGTVRANNDVRIWRDDCIVAIFPDNMPYYTTAHNAYADAEFCAAAPTDIDALLAEVAWLTAEVARLYEAGKDMQEQRDGWQEEAEKARAERNYWRTQTDDANSRYRFVTAERDALAAQLREARSSAAAMNLRD